MTQLELYEKMLLETPKRTFLCNTYKFIKNNNEVTLNSIILSSEFDSLAKAAEAHKYFTGFKKINVWFDCEAHENLETRVEVLKETIKLEKLKIQINSLQKDE